MSGNNFQNIRQYSFTARDQLFFDANIWYFIHGPQGDPSDNRQKVYSNAYKEIISNGSRIFLDVLVLAEFINRFARFHHNLWKEVNKIESNFKVYRDTEDYKEVAKQILAAVTIILVDSRPIESSFTQMNLQNIVNKFGEGDSDFNDLIIEEICRSYHFVLVTDDADYRGTNIPVLTCNRNLLGR